MKWQITKRRVVLILTSFLGACILAIGLWINHLDNSLQERLASGWFLPPIELYDSGRSFKIGETLKLKELSHFFIQSAWRERRLGQPLRDQDYVLGDISTCRSLGPNAVIWAIEAESCLGLGFKVNEIWLNLDKAGQIIAISQGDGTILTEVKFAPQKFAQFYQNQPSLRTIVTMGEVPLYCAQATTAIEDAGFLEHKGISFTGILRALWRNLRAGRFAEGASTITQQLVKNYFLTSEKTLRRKVIEQMTALLLEFHSDKDQILSAYLNVIYMGQNGVFQINGFAAAAEHYFAKRLADLNLPECALLAAIINSPGRYNPFRKAEQALQRRNLVLSRMLELNMIDEPTEAKAKVEPLNTVEPTSIAEPAPFFAQAVLKEIQQLGIPTVDGLRIYTGLNVKLQQKAQTTALAHVLDLEKRFPRLVGGAPLELATISVNVKTGAIETMVGGRQYKSNQFNHAAQAMRQPGSLFKPVVFLAALEHDEKYRPESVIEDAPFTYRYEGQVWSPQNYDRRYLGFITLTEALAQSRNIPTARLGTEIGLSLVAELARRLGISSPMMQVPALLLGTSEVTPIEMAQVYLTLARKGERLKPYLIEKVTDLKGDSVYVNEPTTEQVVRADHVEALLTMMQETFISGTAKVASSWGNFSGFAGKTGTTNDTRDNWFAGFNEDRLGIVWLGFDDNHPTNLSGASAALPLWYKAYFAP